MGSHRRYPDEMRERRFVSFTSGGKPVTVGMAG
jgi:hypothetical protein